MKLAQSFRDIKRLRQIVNILFKYELGYFINKLKLKTYLTFHKRAQREKFKKISDSLPARLRLSMEELSGTFIKLGQLLSLRLDLIPKEYCDEFSKLQDNVKPFQPKQVKEIIESELKKPLNRLFISFEQEPVAAASIGQVHRAVLKNGKKVAIKVQRPNIERIFETDIDLLYHLAHLLENYLPEIKEYNPVEIVEEFERYTKDELDYGIEANNLDIFYNNFKHEKNIRIPKVYPEYTTKKVLTMEYIDGLRISEVKQFSKFNSSKKKVVENFNDSFLKQVLDYGFFHADPHPGNIFLLKDDKIALLDFGIVGRLDRELKEKIENMFIALIKPDRVLLAKSFIDLGFVNKEVNLEQFKEDLSLHLKRYYDLPLLRLKMTDFFYDVLALARKHKMKFPVNFVLLVKAAATAEGFSKNLYPEFNFVHSFRPKLKSIIKQRTSPVLMLSSLKENLYSLRKGIKAFPEEIRKTLKSIQEGKVRVDIEDKDIRKFALEIDRSSNRITFSVIIASFIIGAALITLADLPPIIFGVPALSLLFISIAFILAIFLIISIYKEREV